MSGRRWMLAAAAVAVVVALGAGAVMAQDGETDGTSFLDRVAAKLGVERSQLDVAIKESRDEEIDERVADGDLTQDEADRLKERLDEVPDDGMFPLDRPPGDHHFGFGFQFGDGKEHRFEFNSDDFEGLRPMLKGAGLGLFEVQERLAGFLGIDEGALQEELQAEGATLGSVAESHGKSREELREFLLTELRSGVDDAVAEGWLPEEAADRIYERIAEHVDRFIDAEFGMPAFFPRLFGDGDNGGRDGGDQDAEQDEAPQSGEPARGFRS